MSLPTKIKFRNETMIAITIVLFTIVAYGWYLVMESATRRILGEFKLHPFHVIFLTAVVAFVIVVLFGTTVYELPALAIDEAIIEAAIAV